MKTPSLLSSITFAIVACVGGSILYTLLPLVFLATLSLQITIAVISASYLVFLIKSGQQRTGRVVTFICWALISVAGLWVALPITYFILIQLAMIWLLRSIVFHRSILPSLLDLGLIAIGLLAASWALIQTDSLATALWCFFLVQSLFAYVADFKPTGKNQPAVEKDRFQAAHRVAVDAIQKLTTQ